MTMSSKKLKHIIERFSEDIESIAERFSSKYPLCQLVDFLELWEEEHMDCLFANRFDPRELIEAISEMYTCLTDVLVSHAQDAIKTTALYMLLCIYVKQPERFRSKFRWTCQDLIGIESWCNTVEEKYNNLDPKRALKQFKALNAFDLVEERKIFGPSMIRRSAKDPRERPASQVTCPLEEERKDTMEFFETKLEPSLVGLRNIYAQYDQFRQALELSNYREIGERTDTNTNAGVYLDQAANSLAEFKSNLQPSAPPPPPH